MKLKNIIFLLITIIFSLFCSGKDFLSFPQIMQNVNLFILFVIISFFFTLNIDFEKNYLNIFIIRFKKCSLLKNLVCNIGENLSIILLNLAIIFFFSKNINLIEYLFVSFGITILFIFFYLIELFFRVKYKIRMYGYLISLLYSIIFWYFNFHTRILFFYCFYLLPGLISLLLIYKLEVIGCISLKK